MLKNLLFISGILFGSFLFGQIEIVASDFPGKGDTVRYTNVFDFAIDYQSTGPGLFWNFSNLGGDSQTLLRHNSVDDADMFTQSLFGSVVLPAYRATYYLPATAIPFAELSGLLGIPIDDFYRFYKKSATDLNIIGLSLSAGGYGLGSRADTIETAHHFPMTFGQAYDSRGYTHLDFSFVLPAQLIQYRQRTSEVDGYGNIVTPYGSFDVLRIHHIVYEQDSIYFEFEGAGQWFELPVPTSHEYEWWAKDQKGPILKVTTNEIFGEEVITDVMYRDSFRYELVASIVEKQNFEFNIYPNPASDYLEISASIEYDNLYIISMSGGLVLESEKTAKIDISTLQSGSYQIVLRSKTGGFAIKAFVKE